MKAASSINICIVSFGAIGIDLVGLLQWQLPAVKHVGLLPGELATAGPRRCLGPR